MAHRGGRSRTRARRFAVEPGWLIDEEDGEALDLIAVLREARRPFDEQRRRREEARRQDDEGRRLLRRGPDALRDHLRRGRDREWGLERIGRSAATALQLTIDGDDPLDATEREALHALGTMFEDPLRPSLPDREPGALETVAFEHLVEHHRESQVDRIADLEPDRGDGSSLRLARAGAEEMSALRGDRLPGPGAAGIRARLPPERRRPLSLL